MRTIIVLLSLHTILFRVEANPLADSILATAIALSQSGNYERADSLFSVIASNPKNLDFAFYIARGYNFSWWGKYEEAKINFKEILKIDSDHIDAIIGLAYTTTWAAEFAAAVHIYNRALAQDPRNRSALFGLAHNYLEDQNIPGARYVCNQILKKFATEAETHYLSGIIAVKELDPETARKSFKVALSLDPNHLAAKEQLGKLVQKEGKWQIEGWYGINRSTAKLGHGLRRMQLQYQFNNRHLIYLLYDNSLILDNTFLATEERIAPLLAVGAKYGWNTRLFTKLEVAHRTFTTRPNQTLINLETNYFFGSNVIGKFILQYDDRQSEQLSLMGLALDIGLTKDFSLEATIFHNQNLTLTRSSNQRYQLSSKLLVNNFELVVGGYYDHLRTLDANVQKFSGAFAISTFPLYKKLKGRLFLNYDRGFFNNSQTIAALGLNYHF